MNEVVTSGMTELVTALQGILSLDVFMAALTDLVPVIGGVIIFAFIYRTVRKLATGASKGKAKI